MVKAKHRAFAVLTVVAAFALMAFLAGCSSSSGQNQAASAPSTSDSTGNDLLISISADGWDQETSSPVFVRIDEQSADDAESSSSAQNEANAAGNYSDPKIYAIDANVDQTIPLASGNYTISFISPFNADGSYYLVPGASSVSIDSATPNDPQTFTFEYVEAGNGSQEQVTAIVAAIAGACQDNPNVEDAKAALDRAIANAESNPHADNSAIESAVASAEQAVSESGLGAVNDLQQNAPTSEPIDTTKSNETYTYPWNNPSGNLLNT